MTTKSMRIVEEFIDAWNRMDLDAIVNAFTEDIVYHNIPMKELRGRDAISEYLHQAWRFDEVDWQTLNIAADGDVVLTERIDDFVINGKKVSLPVMGVFEVRGDKICAWRDYFDLAMYKAQLDAVASS